MKFSTLEVNNIFLDCFIIASPEIRLCQTRLYIVIFQEEQLCDSELQFLVYKQKISTKVSVALGIATE
jgi:hypothetical protein